MERWLCAAGDGFVAYSDTGRAWVALGEPVAPPDRIAAVAEEFIAAAAEAGRRVRFFALEDPAAVPGLRSVAIGEQPMWRPAEWPTTVAGARSLREQLRRARAKGVAVRELVPSDLDAAQRRRLEELAGRWQRSRSMAPMRFAVTVDLFGHAGERRYFVAERGEATVGALVAVPIHARDGWLLEDLLRDPAAPNGTTELLFDAAMRSLAAAGAEILSMGMAPLSGSVPWPLRVARATTRWLFDFDGLRRFKAKLRPARWEPVHAAFPTRERGVGAIADVLRSFAGGSLARFAAATAIHRARAVVFLLAALLIPWTALLATGGAGRLFPSPEIQAAWIAYDAALFAGLIALARRWRRRLAVALAAAALIDFGLGLAQLLAWTATRASGADWLAVAAALAAPLGAAAFLLVAARKRPI
jgi:hypothetical protein